MLIILAHIAIYRDIGDIGQRSYRGSTAHNVCRLFDRAQLVYGHRKFVTTLGLQELIATCLLVIAVYASIPVQSPKATSSNLVTPAYYRGGGSCLALIPQATGADLGISVREGGTPPAQQGGMGERCTLPHRSLGRSPKANAFCVQKTPKTIQKSGGQEAFNVSYVYRQCKKSYKLQPALNSWWRWRL